MRAPDAVDELDATHRHRRRLDEPVEDPCDDVDRETPLDERQRRADVHVMRHSRPDGAGAALSAVAGAINLEKKCAADLLVDEITPLTSDMTLTQALQRFMDHPGERLPVVDSLDSPILLGVVNKSALLATYARLSES